MTDNEFRDSWNFSKMVAINIGSVTLSKEDVLAIDGFINRQKAEIESLKIANEKMHDANKAQEAEIDRLNEILNAYALQYGTVRGFTEGKPDGDSM